MPCVIPQQFSAILFILFIHIIRKWELHFVADSEHFFNHGQPFFVCNSLRMPLLNNDQKVDELLS